MMVGMLSRLQIAPRTLAAYTAGLLTGAALTAGAVSSIPFDKLDAFSQALSIIQARYVDEREADALVYDAIAGLTRGLDDHSVFLDPERYRELLEQTSGEYYGVGITVSVQDGRIVITTPLEGSPAAEAGILPGDVIVAVDGVPVDNAAEPALERIRGERGTVVVLGLLRGEENLDIAVRRDQVRTRSVATALLDGGVGWLRIERFQKRTVDEVSEGLAELRKEQGGALTGLIIDVRDNPGGYLSQAVAVADLWVGDGLIVSTVDRSAAAQKDRAQAPGTDQRTPITVLINGGSASAAEILAGALQDQKRASLVGYTSYGKGSVQQFFELTDGSALKLTTARYYTPSGRSIHGSGIDPDFPLGEGGHVTPGLDLAPLFAHRPTDVELLTADPELHVAWTLLLEPAATRAFFDAEAIRAVEALRAAEAAAEPAVEATPPAEP